MMIDLDPIFMRIDEVSKLVSLPKSSIYKLMSNGEFPRPIKIGVGARASSLWSYAELRAFEQTKITSRGPMIEVGPLVGHEIFVERYKERNKSST